MFKDIKAISELKDGENGWVDVVAISVEDKIGTTGKPFVDVVCADGNKTVTAKAWNTTASDGGFEQGNVYFVKIGAKLYRGMLTYELQKWEKREDRDPQELLVGPPVSISSMMAWIEAKAKAMRSPLKDILVSILDTYGQQYQTSAAGRSLHHAYLGGLLYHSYRMAFAAEALSRIYDVDEQLVVCGAILHDIGKVIELDTEWTGSCNYTLRGQLEGHCAIGCDIIRKAARNLGIVENDPDLTGLVHIVASHHGRKEYGAIAEPLTAEAMLVAQLDMIDMQQEIAERYAAEGQTGISPSENLALGHRIAVIPR